MSTKNILSLGLALVTMALTLSAYDHDEEIGLKVGRFLSSHREYQNVRFAVEDEIVTISGKVALWSQRSDLEAALRRMNGVRSVRNQVVLDPPPVSDEVLRARLKETLTAAGFDSLRFQAHQGQVILRGSVRTRPQWVRAHELAWSVEGVREVISRVRVEEE